MKINGWPIAVGLSLILGCTAAHVNESECGVERELVVVSAHEVADLAKTQQAVSDKPQHPEGALGDHEACRRLVSSEARLFDDASMQEVVEIYRREPEKAAQILVKYAQEGARSDAERQKLFFMAAIASQRRTQEATQWMKKAWEIDAPLRRSAAIYGIKWAYRIQNWADIVDFSDALASLDEFRTYRAIALVNLGKYDAAATEFEGIDKFPKEIRLDALDARAKAQSETAQLKAALETYRRIYELDPKSEQGQMAQDAIMAQKDRWPTGFVFPRPAQKVDTSKSARDVALAHFNAHRSEKAIDAYTKLLKEDKKKKDTARVCDDLYAMARSYVKLRAHAKSLPLFREALSTCKNSEVHIKVLYSAAKAAWNAGENEQAIAWYQEIIDQYPDHSYADDAWHYQAQILTGQQKFDEAREKLKAQIARYPHGDMAKDAYWMLLSDLYERGRYEDAVAFVDQNLANAGESDLYTQGRLAYFQARSYEKMGNSMFALRNYLKILEEYPFSYFAMLALGRLEALDPTQAPTWLEANRVGAYRPSQAQDYCFQVIGDEPAFLAAQTLSALELYDTALGEIDRLLSSADVHATYEARLARSILLQRAGRYQESARLAAGLLNPVTDLVNQSYAPWLLAYPMPWSELVASAAELGSTLYYTTYAIMREESYYNPKAESWANARGLMQLMLATAQSSAADIGLAKPSANDLFKPEIAIPIGASYIAKLNRILVPHPMVVLPGYNAGQGNVGKWLTRFADLDVDLYVEKIPFKEARHYAKRVGTTLWRYRWLYDENMPKLFDPAQKLGDL